MTKCDLQNHCVSVLQILSKQPADNENISIVSGFIKNSFWVISLCLVVNWCVSCWQGLQKNNKLTNKFNHLVANTTNFIQRNCWTEKNYLTMSGKLTDAFVM